MLKFSQHQFGHLDLDELFLERDGATCHINVKTFLL